MSNCTNKKLGDLLYAYELGMLSDDENRAFETHLIECSYCSRRAEKSSEATRFIRHDADIHSYVESLTERDADFGHEAKPQVLKKRWTKRIWSYVVPVAAVILLFLLLTDWDFYISPKKEARATENRLTILYLTNTADASDPDHLGDIATNLLITDLSESRYFRVTSSTRLQGILHVLGLDKTQSREGDKPMKIARESGAKWALTGEILKIEPAIIITSQLIDVATGDIMASQQATGQAGQDIFAVIDQLSWEIRKDLPLPGPARTEPDRSVAEYTTHSPDAYRHFLNGVEYKTRFYTVEAIKEFKKALEYDSTMAMAYYYLAELEDREFINKALKFSENASRRERGHIEASYALISENLTEAIALLERLTVDYPDDAYAYWRLGQTYRRQGQTDLAISYYEKAIAADPYYRDAYNSLAYAYDDIDDLEKSILAINKYIDIAPGEANPYDTRGDLLARHGELDKAIESYETALRINPEYYASLEKLGLQYLYRQAYDRADSCFRVLSERGSYVTRMHARFMLVATHLRQGKFACALSIIDSLIVADMEDHDSTNAAYHLSLKSRILVETGQFADAVVCARQSETVLPADSQSLKLSYQFGIVQTLAESGDIEAAKSEIEMLRKRLEEAEMPMTSYWFARGVIEFFDANFNRAIEAFRADSQSVFGFLTPYMLARAYFENGQYDLAAEKFEFLLNDYGIERLKYAIPNVKIHYYLGRTFEESRWYKKAIEQYEAFLSLWKDADTQLDIITDAQERLIRLKQNL